MKSPRLSVFSIAFAALVAAACADGSFGQTFSYEAKPRVEMGSLSRSSFDPAPRMMEPAEEIGHPLPRRRYLDPRLRGRGAELTDLESRRWASRAPESRVRSRDVPEPIAPGRSTDPFIEAPRRGGPMVGPSGAGQGWPNQQWTDGPPTDAPFVDQYGAGGEYDDAGADGYDPGGHDPDGYDQGGYDEYGACDDCPDNRLSSCLCNWWRSPENASAFGRNFTTFTTAQGFKGPVDRGVNGNFGFGKGVNWSMPLVDSAEIGMQAGATLAFSDFDGAAGLVDHTRTQIFVTGGLFHRARCNQGWQGSAVLDYLHDDFYVTMNLLQIRAELGYLWGFHEIGFWGAAQTKSDTRPAPASFGVPSVTWRANNQYNLYYRANFSYGAVGRMSIGLTDFGDILFGGDATAPLSEKWAIQVSQNYLLPRNDSTTPGSIKETWGLTVALVWYPRCKTPNACYDPYRPLFSVADNSWFFVKEKQ